MSIKPELFRRLILEALPEGRVASPAEVSDEIGSAIKPTEEFLRELAGAGELVMTTPRAKLRNPKRKDDGFWPEFRRPFEHEQEGLAVRRANQAELADLTARLRSLLGCEIEPGRGGMLHVVGDFGALRQRVGELEAAAALMAEATTAPADTSAVEAG
jgi:hypothetical protein